MTLESVHGETLPVRVVGGRVPQEGRVEVNLVNRGWRPVCGDGWGAREAMVKITSLYE